MRSVHRVTLIGASLTAVAIVTVLSPIAEATPASGVTGSIISQVTVDDTDYILREITIAPGGSTGWHYHEGTLYAQVQRGTLTHHTSDCAIDGVYSTGSTLVEPSGADHVHLGRNLGSTPVILDVLYFNPAGSPLTEDAPNPGCPFQ
jgi:quercetin dioxygenase-like cupin family protein